MRYLRLALFVLGGALLGVLIARNDPLAILSSITRLSWRLVVVLCFPISVVTLFDTLGWRFAFLHDRVAFRTLLSARLAGEAFNVTTAAVGGEPVKVWLLRRQVPLDESVPAVVVAKTTITIAQGLFLLLGVALAGQTMLSGSPLLRGMLWLVAVEVVAVAGFVLSQTSGVLGRGERLLGRFGVGGVGRTGILGRVDEGLVRFYREEPRRLALSIAFHFVGWLLGSVEAYLILRFLGVAVEPTTATVIEAFGTAVRFATFVIPASLGAAEGGYVVTFAALGLGPAAGMSFGLVRRLREATWAGIGLVVFALMRQRNEGPASVASSVDAAGVESRSARPRHE